MPDMSRQGGHHLRLRLRERAARERDRSRGDRLRGDRERDRGESSVMRTYALSKRLLNSVSAAAKQVATLARRPAESYRMRCVGVVETRSRSTTSYH